MRTLSSDLIDRISRQIGGLMANINSQIQRATEEAFNSQVLLQVQNVLKHVQNRDVMVLMTPRNLNRDPKALTVRNMGAKSETALV